MGFVLKNNFCNHLKNVLTTKIYLLAFNILLKTYSAVPI